MSVDQQPGIDPFLLQALVAQAPQGVTVCAARGGEWPVVYVNEAMQRLTGYDARSLQDQGLGVLHAEDRDQEGLAKIRAALQDGSGCQTTLRNYRRDGTLFFNEVTLVPLRDGNGQITHYASFHREVGMGMDRIADAKPEVRDPAMSTQTMLAYLRDDKLTGLLRRQYFEEFLRRDWSLAQRESRRLSFFVFDLDCFTAYRDVFGKPGADQAFRRIARVIGGCFRRASDLCGRFEEDQIAALTPGLDLTQASRLADAVLTRVRDLAIHHPRSPISRYVTVSAGVVSLVPSHETTPQEVFDNALRALKDAKDLGRNRTVSREFEI